MHILGRLGSLEVSSFPSASIADDFRLRDPAKDNRDIRERFRGVDKGVG